MAEVKPKVTLHWLNMSRAQRIVWLLEECQGCDYDIDVYKRGKDMLAPPELKMVHPLGKSPTITISVPEKPEPVVIAESGLIAEYLCEYFAPHLVPTKYQAGKEGKIGGETEQWLRYRFYIHYNEGSLMSTLLISLIFDQIKTAPQPFFVKPISRGIANRVEDAFLRKNIQSNLAFLEEQLKTAPEGGPYLCGKDLTAADILMSFPLMAAKTRIDTSSYPELSKYTALLENHEGYLRSIKKIEAVTGEPFKLTA